MDPKIIAGVALPVLGIVFAFAWRMGKRAALGVISDDLRALHEDLERAHATPDPSDDEAIEEKIRAKERLKAALDSLPDRV